MVQENSGFYNQQRDSRAGFRNPGAGIWVVRGYRAYNKTSGLSILKKNWSINITVCVFYADFLSRAAGTRVFFRQYSVEFLLVGYRTVAIVVGILVVSLVDFGALAVVSVGSAAVVRVGVRWFVTYRGRGGDRGWWFCESFCCVCGGRYSWEFWFGLVKSGGWCKGGLWDFVGSILWSFCWWDIGRLVLWLRFWLWLVNFGALAVVWVGSAVKLKLHINND